ncbi:DUF2490 domain-containing protein [Sediminitomix flava]|nr:DUF2490 domain-containing protein [Sediminitomix flava]
MHQKIRVFLILGLFFLASKGNAQDNKSILWLDLNANHYLNENTQVVSDVRFRQGINSSLQQTHLRAGLRKNILQNFDMTAGAGYFKTLGSEKEIVRSNEYRFHQDFRYKHRHIGKIKYIYIARLRFEERFFSDTFFGEDTKSSYRWRINSQFQFPIRIPVISYNYFDLKVFDEIFSNFESKKESSFINNNRLGVALKYQLTSTTALEGSYIWEQSFGENIIELGEATNIFRLSMYLTL